MGILLGVPLAGMESARALYTREVIFNSPTTKVRRHYLHLFLLWLLLCRRYTWSHVTQLGA